MNKLLSDVVRDATVAALRDFSQQPTVNGKLVGRPYNAEEVIVSSMEGFGVAVAKTFHGDSGHDAWLDRHRKLVGKPTTKVSLKRTGEVMDAHSFCTSKKAHRQSNNRLKPISLDDADDGDDANLKMTVDAARLPRGAQYFPDLYPQLHPGLSRPVAVSPVPAAAACGARHHL